jgi:hypothetical protein
MAEVNVNERIPAFEIFKEQFRGVFDNLDAESSWLNALYTASKPYYVKGYVDAEIPDMLINDADTAPELQPFRDRFAGIYELRKRKASGTPVAYIPTVAEYVKMDREMKRELQKNGLNSIATNATTAAIIGNDVDLEEMKSRMNDAFFAIDSADEFLKKELQTNFPTVSRSDLALALLRGQEGAQELKKKVEVAGIRAGASEFGFQLQSSAEELQKMGADRAKTRAGFEKIRQELPGLQTAGGLFGTQGNLQKSLEEETILDKASGEAKRLRSQARAQFGGVSGVSGSSLKRRQQVV